MKILFLQHEGRMWGTARSLLALIDQLRLCGHECYVLLRADGPLRNALDDQQVPCANFYWRVWTANEKTSKLYRLLHGLRSILHSRLYRSNALAQIGDFKPNLVHSNTTKTNLGGHLAEIMSVPHIWHLREFIGGRYSVGSEWSLGIRATSRHMSRRGAAVIAISEVLNREFANPELTIPVYIVHNGVMKS